MNTEKNKAVVERLYAAQTVGDISAVSTLLADDVIWRGMGLGPTAFSAGKEEILKIMQDFYTRIDGPWEKEVLGMTAEDNRVAVEAVAHVKLKSGKRYDQIYHYLYVIEDGKIKSAKEYMDTLYAVETFANEAAAMVRKKE